jgi:hypothetical protein
LTVFDANDVTLPVLEAQEIWDDFVRLHRENELIFLDSLNNEIGANSFQVLIRLQIVVERKKRVLLDFRDLLELEQKNPVENRFFHLQTFLVNIVLCLERNKKRNFFLKKNLFDHLYNFFLRI